MRSERGLLGSRIPPSLELCCWSCESEDGGDIESERERGYVCWIGELYDVGGALPDEEYNETRERVSDFEQRE